MINDFKPTLHPDYKVQSRIAFKTSPESPEITGRIVGIAMVHIAFTYIVLLDERLSYESHKDHDAVPVWGTMITRVIEEPKSRGLSALTIKEADFIKDVAFEACALFLEAGGRSYEAAEIRKTDWREEAFTDALMRPLRVPENGEVSPHRTKSDEKR